MFSCLQILEAFLWFVLITLLNVTLIILTLSVSRLLDLLLRLEIGRASCRERVYETDIEMLETWMAAEILGHLRCFEFFFFFHAEGGIRDRSRHSCSTALPI